MWTNGLRCLKVTQFVASAFESSQAIPPPQASGGTLSSNAKVKRAGR